MEYRLLKALETKNTLTLKYQGKLREVIPLAYGTLKNGKEALLHYKINSIDKDGPDLSIRLYHTHKVSEIQASDRQFPFSRKIDYYLTKHFRSFYWKV